jgi:hypothetical protein
MKKVVVTASLLLCMNSLFSQIESTSEKKGLFGFNIGFNHSNLQAQKPISNDGEIYNGAGFRLGLLLDHHLNKNLSFVPKAELSFNNSIIVFPSSNAGYQVMPISTELMAHVVFKKSEGDIKPYFLFGPNFKLPVNLDSKSTNTFGTSKDLAIDLGIGMEKPLLHFIFAPEIRYSYGLSNVNRNPLMTSLHYHNITLAFNFKG